MTLLPVAICGIVMIGMMVIGQTNPSTGLISTLTSGGLAIATLLLALRHMGDSKKHIGAREEFVESKTCELVHEQADKEREGNSKAISHIHRRMDILLANSFDRRDLIKKLSRGESVDIAQEIEMQIKNGD